MTLAGPWQLTTVLFDGTPVAAIETDGGLFRPQALQQFAGAFDAVDSWASIRESLAAWQPRPAERLDDARVQRSLPFAYPRKVLCSGPNYTDHLAEMGESGLGEAWRGYFFLKPATTALISDGDAVLIDDPLDRVDWEGELTVVMARGGRDIPVAAALDHVAGYLVANDISLRRPHRRDTPAAPFVWDWLASKGADTSCPITGMVPAWLVADPQSLRIITRVNGEVMQDGSTANMVLDVAQLIADASRQVTLEPGDLILTGTPAGVGVGRGVFLQPGDVVEIEIPGVGILTNPVRSRS
jgi:2-keto-4-pentenoate hydratase/2-oxohepta-3-ene-1,7-dioic acid hydratase in catechol pathway